MGATLDTSKLVRPVLAGFEPYDPAFSPCEVNLSANEKQIIEQLRDSENLKPTEEKRESLFAKIKYLFTRQ